MLKALATHGGPLGVPSCPHCYLANRLAAAAPRSSSCVRCVCVLLPQAVEDAALHYARMLFLQRLRTATDRDAALRLLEESWGRSLGCGWQRASLAITPELIRVGRAVVPRGTGRASSDGRSCTGLCVCPSIHPCTRPCIPASIRPFLRRLKLWAWT
jgi:hypothetical protein